MPLGRADQERLPAADGAGAGVRPGPPRARAGAASGLRHVLWIGGAPGAGKTTVATRLMRRHGLRLYSSDTRTWLHRDRALAAGSQAAHRWETLPPAERGKQPLEKQLAMSLHRERGQMVVEDVAALPLAPMIVAEGSVITPSCLPPDAHAVWLLPRAPDVRGIPLYARLAEEIEAEVRAARAPVIAIDGVDQTTAAVEELFAAALATAPRAQTLDGRRALLREANLAQVEQVHGFYARPWATGDPEAVERTFICECGDPACVADVVSTVGAVAAAPAIARGH